jgi:NDP-sugar pyrophosphorylase family protein
MFMVNLEEIDDQRGGNAILSPSMASIPVVILAGGLATRLRPLTEKIPKSLVEVAGRPFLEHQIALLRENGITEVFLCIGYLGEMIEGLFGNGKRFGVDIAYSSDGEKLLATGGAIKKLLPKLPDDFFVLYGDSYLPIDYQAVATHFRASGKPALMTVFRNDDAWDRSNVWFEEGNIRRYSKTERLPQMRYIDYGLSICSQPIFENYPADEPFDLAIVFEELSRRGELAGYEVHQRFYEIGSHEGLEDLDRLLRGRIANSQ